MGRAVPRTLSCTSLRRSLLPSSSNAIVPSAKMLLERRGCLRHKVHGPVFASFDGVTGGMILDLSDQGLSMQTAVPLEANQRLHLRLDLPTNDLPKNDPRNNDLRNPEAFETTGYVAWADALGRAGVRFSELPAEARQRLDQWLTWNDQAPSRRAPKLTFDSPPPPYQRTASSAASTAGSTANPRSISLEASLEAEAASEESNGAAPASATIQYEFHSLGPDLNVALEIVSERARTLLRGTGAAVALVDGGPMNSEGMPSRRMLCRASVGDGCPPLGTLVDVNAGFTGECVRAGKAMRCDDAETDARVEAEVCRRLGIRSIVAAPIHYEGEVVGLIEVFSSVAFAFDEGDLAVLERLVRTVLLLLSQQYQGLRV